MINFQSLIENESVPDVVSYLASGVKGIDYRSLDRLFVRYRFSVIAEGELLATVKQMADAGVIQPGEGAMVYVKGPNWKPPQFVSENNYSI